MHIARLAGWLIGWLLLLLAVAALGYEATASLDAGSYQLKAAGEIWYAVHSSSLNAAQAGIQRYLSPFLWEPVITFILLLPGWLVFGVPGLGLVWTCQRNPGRRRRIRRFY